MTPACTSPGRERTRARAGRGPAPSPDVAPWVRGDWRARPLDEWGDRGGGAGRGMRRAEGAGRGRHRPAPLRAVNSPHALRVEEGSGTCSGPRARRGCGGPEVMEDPEGVRSRLGGRDIGVAEEKPRPPSLTTQRLSTPEDPSWRLGARCVKMARTELFGVRATLGVHVLTRSVFPSLHQHPVLTSHFTLGHPASV